MWYLVHLQSNEEKGNYKYDLRNTVLSLLKNSIGINIQSEFQKSVAYAELPIQLITYKKYNS